MIRQARVELYNFTVRGFRSKEAGIFRMIGGSLTIADSHFEDNEAPFGGVINFLGNGVVNIDNSKFVNNQGQASPVFSMIADASLTVRNSSFLVNKATNGAAVIVYSGRGVFLFENCEFIGN